MPLRTILTRVKGSGQILSCVVKHVEPLSTLLFFNKIKEYILVSRDVDSPPISPNFNCKEFYV
jgi:hypothetical protein